jgi:hypothetical protein
MGRRIHQSSCTVGWSVGGIHTLQIAFAGWVGGSVQHYHISTTCFVGHCVAFCLVLCWFGHLGGGVGGGGGLWS